MNNNNDPPLSERVKTMTADEIRELKREMRKNLSDDPVIFKRHLADMDVLTSALVLRGLSDEGIEI